jgi:hypothetical protein
VPDGGGESLGGEAFVLVDELDDRLEPAAGGVGVGRGSGALEELALGAEGVHADESEGALGVLEAIAHEVSKPLSAAHPGHARFGRRRGSVTAQESRKISTPQI